MNTTAVDPQTIPIIVVSDFNCPWCYVAHREVQAALKKIRAEFPDGKFQLQYRPYLLDPTLPKPSEKPICRIACYKAKFGEQKLKEITQRLLQRGKEAGIDFHIAGKTRQSTNAHRLALKAWCIGGEQTQTRTVEALFAAYYQESTDNGDLENLAKAAESAGLMSSEDARTFLGTSDLTDEVGLLIRNSILRGISSVPFTVIDNYWAIQGAEKADTFYEAFKNAYLTKKPERAKTPTQASVDDLIVSQNAPACTAPKPAEITA